MSGSEATDNNPNKKEPKSKGTIRKFGEDQAVFLRDELFLSFGAVPLVLGVFRNVARAISWSGLASRIVDWWAPVMAAVKTAVVAALAAFALPVSPAYQPFVPVAVQLGIVLGVAVRRWGFTSFWTNAPAKFGWGRTGVHYPVHVFASVVLLAYVLEAAGVDPFRLHEQDWPQFLEAGDVLVAVVVALEIAALTVWHAGVNVRVLILFVGLMLADALWLLIDPYLPSAKTTTVEQSLVIDGNLGG